MEMINCEGNITYSHYVCTLCVGIQLLDISRQWNHLGICRTNATHCSGKAAIAIYVDILFIIQTKLIYSLLSELWDNIAILSSLYSSYNYIIAIRVCYHKQLSVVYPVSKICES